MTERKPLYHECHGKIGPTDGCTVSPLVQHEASGTTSRDIIFLLPLLASSQSSEQPSRCMQPVLLSDGNRTFCNRKTDDLCSCCGFPVCGSHFISSWVTFPDETNESGTVPLCQTCLCLTSRVRTALHAFCRLINTQEKEYKHAER
jgi:hypothetical protein